MPRVVSPILTDFYRDIHTSKGVEISLYVALSDISGHQGRVTKLVLSEGSVCPADLVLVGIGVVPNVELAGGAGLSVSNGIVVDEHLRRRGTRASMQFGDCADHPNPFAGGRVRIESVQNAVDQAKCVAAAIVGRSDNYRAVPWFWTDQFDIKLQMAGLSRGYGRIVTQWRTRESQIFGVLFQGRSISRR